MFTTNAFTKSVSLYIYLIVKLLDNIFLENINHILNIVFLFGLKYNSPQVCGVSKSASYCGLTHFTSSVDNRRSCRSLGLIRFFFFFLRTNNAT